MEQELAVAPGGVVHLVGVAVGRYLATHEKELTPTEVHVGVAEAEASLANGLHLRAEQGDTGFHALQNVVLKEGLPILRENALAPVGLRHALMLADERPGPARAVSHPLTPACSK